jgi:hypothetical protein
LLESQDNKFTVPRVGHTSMLAGHEDDTPLGETGDLANILLKDGRAMVTLGHEEEIRKLWTKMMPKKVSRVLITAAEIGKLSLHISGSGLFLSSS